MGQESTSKSVAIIGGGPAGCICAYFLQNKCSVTIFEKKDILKTLLPTGGGKCNLAHAEFDFKELAKNYPRGEKFLYSIFSRFGTQDTIDFFKSIGIETYTREDDCIFPISNSSIDVRKKFLQALKSQIIKEEVINITNQYTITTNKNKYLFDYVVIAIGGHSSTNLLKNYNLNMIEPTPSLVGLITKEDFSKLAGVSLNGLLFTHKGVSGPLIYKYSSLNARKPFPYKMKIKLAQIEKLQEILDKNPHKEIKNVISKYIPKSLAEHILGEDKNKQCHTINSKTRDQILDKLMNFEFTVTGKVPDSEVVTCGGIDLKEINSKTLESKKYRGLYFCGEILDIDGFCGGFNLQNCWSTGFVASQSIQHNL